MQVQDEKITNFESDNEKLHPKHAEEEQNFKFEDAIKKIAAKEGYIEYISNKKRIESDGGNYLGELFVIDIEGTTKDGEKETNMFVKKILTDCKLTIMNIEEVFEKEIYMYTELNNIYRKLQDNANIPLEDRFEMVKCYYTIDGKCIFMENMIKKGFSIPNRMETVTINYAQSCIKDLAKFHALFFALEKDNPNYVEEKLKCLEYHISTKEEWMDFVEDSLKHALSVLKTAEDQNRLEDQIPMLKKSFQDFMNNKEEARVLCHADFRGNNILVKNMDTADIKTIPIDYQLCYFGNPLNDFFYYIFGGTDKEFRSKHMIELKELYYDTLEKFLKYFDIDVEDTYPRKVYDNDYNNRLLFGMTISTVLLRFVLAPEDEFPDFGDIDITNMGFVPTHQYIDRIRGIFEDFVEWGII